MSHFQPNYFFTYFFDETTFVLVLTDGGDRRDYLSQFQLVEDCGLSRGVESHCKFEKSNVKVILQRARVA